ncbi:hypothetical protein KBC04_03570 [Candidatus Babeliales bacterium]|nr:hypothetical protein [Candidatus Babeliales bacterium]MBP9843869.1 hypothetical protein [Candidatus Babeliales bacterium]
MKLIKLSIFLMVLNIGFMAMSLEDDVLSKKNLEKEMRKSSMCRALLKAYDRAMKDLSKFKANSSHASEDVYVKDASFDECLSNLYRVRNGGSFNSSVIGYKPCDCGKSLGTVTVELSNHLSLRLSGDTDVTCKGNNCADLLLMLMEYDQKNRYDKDSTN